jgi:O-antigen ligase
MGPMIAAAMVCAFGAVASFAITALSGTKTGVVLALGAIGGPALLYVGLIAPLVFPFTFYVMLVPFDNLLALPAFGTMTKLFAIVSGAALVFYLVRTRQAVRPDRALLVWVALFAWTAATGYWAVDQTAVWKLLPTAVELLALYAVISMFPCDRRIVTYITLVTIAGGVIASAYGTYLFRHGVDVSDTGRLFMKSDTNVIDPNHFAASLLLPIGLSIGIALYARRLWIALAAIGTLLILMEGIAVAASRGAMAGIGAMVVYFIVRSSHRWKLIIVSIPAAAAVILTKPDLMKRFSEASSGGGSGRLDIWKVAWAAEKMHWLLGAGYNNFAFAYDQAFLATRQSHFSGWHRAPHDLIVQTAVELGVLGLALMLAAWVVQFRVVRDVPKSDPDYAIRLALEATVIGTFVAALVLDLMVMKYLWLTFMLMAIVRNAHLRRLSNAPNVSPLLPAVGRR